MNAKVVLENGACKELGYTDDLLEKVRRTC